MKISALGYIKNFVGAATFVASGLAIAAPMVKAQAQTNNKDMFTLTHNNVPVSGTKDSLILANAPSPAFILQGAKENASIVVNLSENVLYQYDERGKAMEAFLVASGKNSTPTGKGLRAITHVETYPYRGAPVRSKRRRNPSAYGPKIIMLETVDPKTGARGVTGEFIHGNNNIESLGRYASKGCIRMDNEIIKKLARQVKRGQFVLIK